MPLRDAQRIAVELRDSVLAAHRVEQRERYAWSRQALWARLAVIHDELPERGRRPARPRYLGELQPTARIVLLHTLHPEVAYLSRALRLCRAIRPAPQADAQAGIAHTAVTRQLIDASGRPHGGPARRGRREIKLVARVDRRRR